MTFSRHGAQLNVYISILIVMQATMFRPNAWDEYVVTIDLNTPAANRSITAAKRSTTSDFRREPTYRQEDLDIVAGTFYEGGEDSNF